MVVSLIIRETVGSHVNVLCSAVELAEHSVVEYAHEVKMISGVLTNVTKTVESF
jgi:hypothetical protein